MLSWRHHYIPQFYLKQWYLPGENKLLRYYKDLKSNIIEEKITTKQTGFIKNQNSLDKTCFMNKNASDNLEKKYAKKIDDKAAIVHKKLLKRGKSNLCDNEIIIWATFINSIIYRSPRYFYENIRNAKEIRKNVLASFKNTENDIYKKIEKLFTEIDAINNYKKINYDYLTNCNFVEFIKNAIWINTKINEGFQLITSDYPLVLNLSESDNPVYIINFPLSPQVLQTIYFIEDCDINKYLELTIEILLIINLCMILQSPNCIYSTFKLTDDGVIKYKKIMELSLKPRRPDEIF